MITIGITTYNRLEILEIMADSLYRFTSFPKINIRIYDDASSDYDSGKLKKLFPTAVAIQRNENNVKADKNMYLMYRDFLLSEDEILVHVDADLIFSEKWIEKALLLYKQTDGILSLYNSLVIAGVDINDNLLQKPYVGAAGVMLSRECVKIIVDKFSMEDIVGDTPFFDWRWCRYLRELGHNIYCVKESLVQHIGFSGQNSSRMLFDYGIGFNVEDKHQGQIINDILLKMAIRDKNARGWYALFPFHVIPKNSRVVIYGYGSVGKDYVKQIQASKYCNLEAVVDENYLNIVGASDPRGISNLKFDYIILAMLDIEAQREVRDKLLKEFPDWKNRIIIHIPERIEK